MKSDLMSGKETYRFNLTLVVLCHVLLFSMLLLTYRPTAQPLFLQASRPPTIIHATAVEESQLLAEHSGEQQQIKQTVPATKPKQVAIQPALVEKSPLTLPITTKQRPKKVSNTTSVMTKSRVTASIPTKKLPLEKHRKPPSPGKKQNATSIPSPTLLTITQQLLQQEIKMRTQKQETAASNTALTEKYRQLILQAIARQWIVPPELNKHLETRLAVHLAPGGMVLEVIIVKSSGNGVLDRSAQTAVYKASPLPIPKNTAFFDTFRHINLTVRPEGIMTQSTIH